MDLLSLRAAAHGGSIDGHAAAGLVAAGFTLLQRNPTLVRALAGKRAALLLPNSSQFLVALAAGDGRGAVLVDPLLSPSEVARRLSGENVGAAFTISELSGNLPAGTTHALLDDAPAHATVVAADGTRTRVDLGSHFGLDIEGDADAAGRDEECAIVHAVDTTGRADRTVLTHRELFADARRAAEALALTREDHILALAPFVNRAGFAFGAIAPLFVGSRITTIARPHIDAALDRLAADGLTVLVGDAAAFEAMLDAAERRGGFAAPTLRACVCTDAPDDAALRDRWLDRTSLPLRLAVAADATR